MIDVRKSLDGLVKGLRRLDAALTPGGGSKSGDGTISGDPVTGPALFLRKAAFGPVARADTWQLLADIVKAGPSIDATVEMLIKGCLRTGRRNRALVLAEMGVGVRDNNVGERLAPYVSAAERLVLEGIGSRKAEKVLAGAAQLVRNRMALRKAMQGALAMPLLLISGVVAIVIFVGLQLLPALGKVIDLEAIPGWQGVVVQGILAFSANPGRVGAILGGVIVAIAVSTRLWIGPGRTFADRFPPWSLVRLQAGTGFLFAVIEAGRAGTAVTPALLERMAKAGGRYEASRIRALIPGLLRTGNLGTAALDAGQGFPDDELSLVLEALWNRDDGVDRAGDFVERRLERVESAVRARMAVLNAVLMATVAAALVIGLLVVVPVVDEMMSSLGGI